MQPASAFAPEQLVGKRIAFQDDLDHHSCWHHQVGLKTGVVRKLGQSLAQKAELIGGLPADLVADEAEVVRVWIKADPCPAFPRGCEAAVDIACLLVLSE